MMINNYESNRREIGCLCKTLALEEKKGNRTKSEEGNHPAVLY
jgi:hypothetical protein